MRKLTMSLPIALLVSTIGIFHANAQVKWEQYTGGWTWDQNSTFFNELVQSVDQFFGKAVGAYFMQSPDSARSIPPREWAMISTQFFGGELTGSYSRGTILNGQWEIYTFSTGSGPVTAFVTPVRSTRVVAAAINSHNCTSLAAEDIDSISAFKSHFDGDRCMRPLVTIFFKDKFDVNPLIRRELVKFMSDLPLGVCHRSALHTLGTLESKRFVATHGHAPPPCRVSVKVVMVDQLPSE